MSQIWDSVRSEVVAALVAIIPVAGMTLRAWLQNRANRWNKAGERAWENVHAPAGAPEAMLEQLAARALEEQGLTPKQAVTVARRTRPIPIPISEPERAAIVPPAPSERPTFPSPGVKPPTG